METCYCSVCSPWIEDAFNDEDDEDRPPTGFSIVYLYPSYAYHFQVRKDEEDAVAAERQRMEQTVHDYMVRMRKLPKPFRADLRSQHEPLIDDAVKDLAPRRTCCSPFVTRSEALQAIKEAARGVIGLVIVLCSHGQGNALALSDGSKLGVWEIPEQLKKHISMETFYVWSICQLYHQQQQIPAVLQFIVDGMMNYHMIGPFCTLVTGVRASRHAASLQPGLRTRPAVSNNQATGCPATPQSVPQSGSVRLRESRCPAWVPQSGRGQGRRGQGRRWAPVGPRGAGGAGRNGAGSRDWQ
eukprot:366444-Chlamydomonas_euryale.AAC.1